MQSSFNYGTISLFVGQAGGWQLPFSRCSCPTPWYRCGAGLNPRSHLPYFDHHEPWFILQHSSYQRDYTSLLLCASPLLALRSTVYTESSFEPKKKKGKSLPLLATLRDQWRKRYPHQGCMFQKLHSTSLIRPKSFLQIHAYIQYCTILADTQRMEPYASSVTMTASITS